MTPQLLDYLHLSAHVRMHLEDRCVYSMHTSCMKTCPKTTMYGNVLVSR